MVPRRKGIFILLHKRHNLLINIFTHATILFEFNLMIKYLNLKQNSDFQKALKFYYDNFRSTSSDTTKENGTASKGPLVLLKEFPTCNKLVENFKRIRDNEWRSAFHDLEKHYKLSEEVITELLAGIARVSDLYCCFRPVLFRISRINCVIFFIFYFINYA